MTKMRDRLPHLRFLTFTNQVTILSMSSTRHPKLPPLPNVATSSPLRLLCLVVKQSQKLSYKALGALLGVGEFKAERLCQDDDAVMTQALVDEIHGAAYPILNVPPWTLAAWRPGHDALIDDAVAAILDDTNTLRRLRRRARYDDDTAPTVDEFATSLGISRQYLHKLETSGSSGQRGYDGVVATVMRVWRLGLTKK